MTGMTNRVEVVAGATLLESLVRTPVTGICELIWNALDADAENVEVTVRKNTLEGVESVVVTDDGIGMNEERAALAFKNVGDSWKGNPGALSEKSRRLLHGKEGRGRYAAFGLGENVAWTTVAEQVIGGNAELNISGTRADLKHFEISDPKPTPSATGTSVSISQPSSQAEKELLRVDDIRNKLLTTFAMYLQRYPQVTITWEGSRVDPSKAQVDIQDLTVTAPDGVTGQIVMTVIDWNLTNVPRKIFLCDTAGSILHEVPARIQAPGAEFTAYVKWDGFAKPDANLLFAESGDSPAAQVLAAAKVALKRHLDVRALAQERRIVTRWQSESVYPYKGEPANAREAAERQAFNLVALTAARIVDDSKSTKVKKLSLRLIKEALESAPGSLHTVLDEVLNLPDDRVEELRGLLERTTLATVISSSKQVGNRLDFLQGLQALVFDADSRKATLERRQLHRILAAETWIFGEEWALTGDDERLIAVLKKYLQKLGSDIELAEGEELKREDGRDAIPDLVLSKGLKTSKNEYENLVVELKRPSHELTTQDVDQIRSYASTVANDERFQQPNVKWDFWLIGNTTRREVDDQRIQRNMPFGVVTQNDRYTVWVKTWAEVIGDAEHRHKFLQESLDYTTSHDHGIKFLKEKHADYLPDVLMADQTQGLPGASVDQDSDDADEERLTA